MGEQISEASMDTALLPELLDSESPPITGTFAPYSGSVNIEVLLTCGATTPGPVRYRDH